MNDTECTPPWHIAAFNYWYQNNQTRFSIPIALAPWSDSKANDGCIKITFPGWPDILYAILSERGIDVRVDHTEDWSDCLYDCEVSPVPHPQGLIDNLTLPEYQKVFPDIISIWQENVFECFLNWVNKKLAPAHWLRLYQLGEGTIDTELIYNEADKDAASAGMIALSGLKSLSGELMFDREKEVITVRLYPMDGQGPVETFRAQLET